MPFQIRTIVTTLVIAISSSGCVPFPHYSTIQPDIKIEVKDEAGYPIPNASILFISASYPHRVLHNKAELHTNSQGKAELARERKWESSYPFMLHGVRVYYWAWCISKSGYETISSETTETSSRATVTLKKGATKTCSNDEGYINIH